MHPKLQTPVYSLLLIYVISLIFLLAPPPGYVFQFIVAFSGYGGYLFCKCMNVVERFTTQLYRHFVIAALSVIGLLMLRRTQPDLKRPIKVPIRESCFSFCIATSYASLLNYKINRSAIAIIFIVICFYTLIFVWIPPSTPSAGYPYYRKSYHICHHSRAAS